MGIEKLAKSGTLHTYMKGRVICREGDEGETAFIVISGAVNIVLNFRSAHPELICVLEAGSFVGEMSLFLKHKRTATVTTSVDGTTILEVDMDSFGNFLREDAGTCFKLMKSLTVRIDEMLVKIGDFDKKFQYQFKKSTYYQLAHQLYQPEFWKLANENPEGAINLIKYLCSSLESLNNKYMSSSH